MIGTRLLFNRMKAHLGAPLSRTSYQDCILLNQIGSEIIIIRMKIAQL